MPTATSNQQANERLARKLRRRSRPFTAAQVGLTSAQLRDLGFEVVGKVSTGKAGRPALLFLASKNSPVADEASDDAGQGVEAA